MIILFEENEIQFNSLGLGILSDATECTVSEALNDTFELSMRYPINGKNYDKLKENRLIYCKVNPYDEAQPFRIKNITKPLNGIVSIKAVHISYDMNGIPVKAIRGDNLPDLLSKIQNERMDENNEIIRYSMIDNNFKFATDITMGRTYETTSPFNMRAIFMGDEDSIVSKYNAELKFDKFLVQLLTRRGRNRGAVVKYGHNMTDLSHETDSELLYNGIFPYYHSEKTTTQTSTEDTFTQVYIVGSKLFQEDWLSYRNNGEPFIPIDESPVQIATEGDYYQKVYTWSSTYQKYIERIYNEQVMVIQGVFEPTWISIDWSAFPTVRCKANKKGYFKKSSDTDWGQIRGVGDIIFEGLIVSSGIIENLILNFSEVIPTTGNKENVEVTEIIDVQLDDPIIWLDSQDAKNMLHNNVLLLDLSSEFDESENESGPTKESLKAKAEEYIQKNKLGTIKHTTTVSFVDLASTTESDKYKNFDHIELGDDVRIIYEDIGVDVSLRVITTDYDALAERYTRIDLGEKKDSMSSESIQSGDDVSSLTNDAGYASVTTVHKLIAETITAEYLEAINAKLSNAQIKQLEVERIKATGIIEASQFELDTIIAKLLIADNAQISDTLTAGKIRVAGDITITSGEIRIQNESGSSFFRVDRDGNLTANSVNITGGELNINEGVFLVQNDGTMFATNAFIEGEIKATSGVIGGANIVDGVLQVPSASIEGLKILSQERGAILFEADSNTRFVNIAGFQVNSWVDLLGNQQGCIKYGNINRFNDRLVIGNCVYIGTDGIRLGNDFKVDPRGNVTANTLKTIVSVTIEYGVSDSSIIAPTQWFDEEHRPPIGPGQYQWIKHETLYTDGTSDIYFTISKVGEDGTSINIKYNVETYSDLADIIDMEEGDGALVDDASDDPSISTRPSEGILYVYYKITSTIYQWKYSGQIKGPKGDSIITGSIYYRSNSEIPPVTPSSITDQGWYQEPIAPTVDEQYIYKSNYKFINDSLVSMSTPILYQTIDEIISILEDNGINIIEKILIHEPEDHYEYYVKADHINGVISDKVTISGFSITSNSLYNGTIGSNNSIFLSSTGITTTTNIGGSTGSNTWSIIAGNTFGITKTGKVYATDVELTGKINASAGGKIANISIIEDGLRYISNNQTLLSIKPTNIFSPSTQALLPQTTISAKSAEFNSLIICKKTDSYNGMHYSYFDSQGGLSGNGLKSVYVTQESISDPITYQGFIRTEDIKRIPIVDLSTSLPSQTYDYGSSNPSVCPKIVTKSIQSPGLGFIEITNHGMNYIESVVACLTYGSTVTTPTPRDNLPIITTKIDRDNNKVWISRSVGIIPDDCYISVIIVGY